MINVKIRYMGKELSTEIPKRSHELSAELKKAGIDLPSEKLKLRSSAKDQYLVGLYTNDPLGDVIIDRLCDNDDLLELNNLCEIMDKASDRDNIMRCILDSDVRCINGIKKLFADRFIEFSDKLVLNTSLERKPTGLAVNGCIIEKAIPVSHRKFEAITKAPLRDEPLIAENKDIMYFDSKYNMYHCILIYDKDFGDGIVVESEGSDYARYAQYVPQASPISPIIRAIATIFSLSQTDTLNNVLFIASLVCSNNGPFPHTDSHNDINCSAVSSLYFIVYLLMFTLFSSLYDTSY